MSRIQWNSKEVQEILSDTGLSVKDMAYILGRSVYTICHRRKELGITFQATGNGLGRRMTNKERKAKYNAKIKYHRYLPIYKWNNEQEIDNNE